MRFLAIVILLVSSLLVLLTAGCGGAKSETLVPPTPSPSSTTPAQSSKPEPSTTSAIPASSTPAPVKPPTPVVQGKVSLEVTTPLDESLIAAADVTVTGKTVATAIVSVNGILVKVKDDGTFAQKVPLELGPNIIQVVASTVSGDEVGKVLAVARTK